MNDKGYFVKFTFLAVMIGVVLFSRMAYPAAAPTSLAEVTSVARSNMPSSSVPTFVLPSTAVSAGANAGAGTTTDDHLSSIPSLRTAAPVIQNTASLAADMKTGAIYDATGADRRWPTASLAKLMAATIVADKFDPTTRITITEGMFAADLQEQTLVVGRTYTVNDLLHLMLLPSSNVAAEAVAAFYGRDAFIAEMNARAAEWGMEDTHYDDPSGISAGDESTANDLLILAQKIYTDYPQLLAITRTPQYSITEQSSGKSILIKSINDFAGEADFVGGKTGHTEQADGNLLSVFRYGGRVFCIIVLGSNDRFGDTKTLYDWLKGT